MWARLEPAPAEQHFGEAVPGEIVRAHLLVQRLAREVIGHVREADARRNARGAAQRGAERRLADAIAGAGREHARGAIDFRVVEIEIGVVAHLARREIEPPRLFGRRGMRRDRLGDERLDGRMIAVDEFGGAR